MTNKSGSRQTPAEKSSPPFEEDHRSAFAGGAEADNGGPRRSEGVPAAPEGQDLALTDDAAAIEERATANVRDNLQTLKAEYKRLHGKLVDTNRARGIVSPEYDSSPETRCRYGTATHEPAKTLARAVLNDLISEPVKPEEEPELHVVMGGPGSGKSAATDEAEKDAHVVLNTVGRSLEEAIRLIEQALAACLEVQWIHVLRDVREAWFNGVLSPARLAHGRITPLRYHVETHLQAIETSLEIVRRYQDDLRVHCQVISVGDSRGEPKRGSPGDYSEAERYLADPSLPRPSKLTVGRFKVSSATVREVSPATIKYALALNRHLDKEEAGVIQVTY